MDSEYATLNKFKCIPNNFKYNKTQDSKIKEGYYYYDTPVHNYNFKNNILYVNKKEVCEGNIAISTNTLISELNSMIRKK